MRKATGPTGFPNRSSTSQPRASIGFIAGSCGVEKDSEAKVPGNDTRSASQLNICAMRLSSSGASFTRIRPSAIWRKPERFWICWANGMMRRLPSD